MSKIKKKGVYDIMKTTIGSTTIPQANQIIELFDVIEQGKNERADARMLGRIQKAFKRSLRFSKWTNENFVLIGIRYKDLYAVTWLQDFFIQNGYEVVPINEEKMSDVQYNRALRKNLRLNIRR